METTERLLRAMDGYDIAEAELVKELRATLKENDNDIRATGEEMERLRSEDVAVRITLPVDEDYSEYGDVEIDRVELIGDSMPFGGMIYVTGHVYGKELSVMLVDGRQYYLAMDFIYRILRMREEKK